MTNDNPKAMNEKLITLLVAVIALAAGTVMQSCDSNDDPDPDIIWDIYPINFNLSVQNEAGDDLLADSAFVETISLTHNGKTTSVTRSESRAYWPHWGGAQLHRDKEGTNHIVVGEFDGAGDYSDEFVLTIDGTDYHFSFSTKDTYKKKDVKFTRHYYLDGKKIPPFDNSCLVGYTIVR